MVLTLSNGGVYFFQAGTEELVNEWVSTCNYWAARTSREPLAGGVSNMEYGWNRVVDNQRRAVSDSDSMHAPEPVDNFDTASVRSGRSSRSRFAGRREAAALRAPGSPYSDRVFINDWTPPMPSMVPSAHDEESQYDALKKHVESLKTELETHNELRNPMMALVCFFCLLHLGLFCHAK
jgi:PH and SEC7 domain-containing protein